MKFILKEMVFNFGDSLILVISNDSDNVSLVSVQAGLKLASFSKSGLASTSTATAATGFIYTHISAFCTSYNSSSNNNNNTTGAVGAATAPTVATAPTAATAPSVPTPIPTTNASPSTPTIAHTVLNERILRLGEDAEVHMSAGCEGVMVRMKVKELQRLMTNFHVVNC